MPREPLSPVRDQVERHRSKGRRTRTRKPPNVDFMVTQHVVRADPPGVTIYIELERNDASRVAIRETSGRHVAIITVHKPWEGDLLEETKAVTCALYWSWWRANEARLEAEAAAADKPPTLWERLTERGPSMDPR